MQTMHDVESTLEMVLDFRYAFVVGVLVNSTESSTAFFWSLQEHWRDF